MPGSAAGGLTAIPCFSIGHLLPRGSRFLQWKGGDQASKERDGRDFLEAVFGPTCCWSATETDQGPAFCLEELTSQLLSSMALGRGGGHRCGLAGALRPYLRDLLTRRQGLRGAADVLASFAESDARLPKVLAEVTAKDLFVALLLSTPAVQRPRLGATYAGLRAPLPVVFRGPEGAEGASSSASASSSAGPRLRTLVAFDLLKELACVPCSSRHLIVNLGTQLVAGLGKTSSLSMLALTSLAEEDLDVHPAGPMHSPSCDLLCADGDRWIADVHGHWSGADEAFRAAVLALAAWGRAAVLVHCGLGDFNARTGAPRKELAALLTELRGAVVPHASVEGGPAARCAGVVLLLRDAASEALATKRASIEASLWQFGAPALVSLESSRGSRGGRGASGAERLRGQVREAVARLQGGVEAPELPGVDELFRVHWALTAAGRSTSSQQHLRGAALVPGEAPAPPSPARAGLRPLGVGAELRRLLDEALATGSATSALFPLCAAKGRLLDLRLGEGKAAGAAQGGARQGQRRGLGEKEELEREAEVRALEKKLEEAACSDAMRFFCEVMSSQEPLAVVSELSHTLSAWREPRAAPLLARQSALLDQLSAEGSSGQEKLAEDSDKKLEGKGSLPGSAGKELEAVTEELAALDLGLDSFWAELALLAPAAGGEGAAAGRAAGAAAGWRSLLSAGHPFQVLHGRPLQLAGRLLRDVLQAIDAPRHSPQGLFVVSVLGAQSSAKSALLNFLFGCGFAVRAGRCTRGLYASYFEPSPTGPALLVLDSEGLLSLSSEGSVFDGQIALMCMSCSHLVIVNNKGELSRQLQDLLEICLFATRHLRLARLQPRLVFVLRDQHDRSRAMHEDMLKRMRGHLETVASSLGTPLDDLVRIDSTAVFLLPSAITSELRQNQEVCWTSELFAREVLALRREVFRWLKEDMHRQPDGPQREFSSLANWYDYAAAVWETLEQFSEQLLHYKTIHEVELRRELAEAAKAAAREALNAPSVGFHARARATVDRFVARIQGGSSRLDLERTDLELVRELASLRDECSARLEDLFKERASSPRFTATVKEQATLQIRTPIEWAFENHLYTWKLHLKRASDEREMHELWVHFVGVLNRQLESSGHRSCLSAKESKELFENEWRTYEASFISRLQRLMKDKYTLVHEVTLVFNHAVGKLQHEAGALALLKEMGPQQVAGDPKNVGSAPSTLLEQSDEQWEEQFFATGWWDTVKMKGLALLQSSDMGSSTGATPLRGRIIPRLRHLVFQGLQQFREDVTARGVLDESTAGEGLRHITGVTLHEIESRLLATGSVATLKRPQMLHALHVALRKTCVEALLAVESSKQAKASSDLLAQKASIEEHFLSIVQASKGDVERATNFAVLYHQSIMTWLDHEVTQLAADVRNQVLEEMPDPQKSSERAFQLSFVARSWPDVLEYVLDTSSYLEKIYLGVFHQRKRAFVGPARSRLEKRARAAFFLLKDIIGQWARQETGSPKENVGADVAKGLAPGKARRPIKDLKDLILSHSECVPPSADTAEAHRHLADCLPATANFSIADAKLFADTVQARTADVLDGQEIRGRIMKRLDIALQEQSVQAWSLVHGCSERCPLCGSKCDLVGEHANHHCAHHLFPAFHGWMDCDTGLPSFNHCLGAATRAGTYECTDGTLRKFEEYLRSEHPAWVAFLCSDPPSGAEGDLPHLRAAWVNCRQPLLEYFAPMNDDCPQQWIEEFLDEKKVLTKKDLEVAKDTIRKLRKHEWVPPD